VKHSEIRARLSDYLERDLSPEESSRIETHLEACAPCGSELRELRATVSLLRRLPEPAHPQGLGEAVMARVARDGIRPARVRWPLRRAADPRIAALLAAGIAGLFFLFQTGDPGLTMRPFPAVPLGTVARGATPAGQPGQAQIASAGSREAGSLPSSIMNGLWGPDEPRARAALPARAGVVSGATPSGAYAEYMRRAQLREVARLLRGAGHPYSASLASHFEAQPTVVMADWQPR